ncbi:MAG: PhoH family protein [Alphaproteobacteria bacterium]|nr:PhoH family protein [Alphaproteobacteria bacterium]
MAENHILEFKNKDLVPLLFGEHNAHITYIEQKLGIHIADRGNRLTLSGPEDSVEKAEKVLNSLWARLEKKQDIGTAEIDAALRFLNNGKKNGTHAMKDEALTIETRKKPITARSPNQAAYIEAVRQNSMVFGLGPAGTGKTYLAVAAGVSLYLKGEVERLIFCRPAVEAGERLGFLPGDMKEKIDPYLRPIYDALHDMLPSDFMLNKMESGDIEIAPLAFMRGRTLNNAFVILDEAQNTTTTQMKMFLTRMGENTRMVITGDLTQTDLPVGVKSGLRDATEVLEGVEEIRFIHFRKEDVIRHPLVGRIVHAYDQKK